MQRRFVTSLVAVLIFGVHSTDVLHGETATAPSRQPADCFCLDDAIERAIDVAVSKRVSQAIKPIVDNASARGDAAFGEKIAKAIKPIVDHARTKLDTAEERTKEPIREAGLKAVNNAAAQATAEQKRAEADGAEKLANAAGIHDRVTAAGASKARARGADRVTAAQDFIDSRDAVQKTVHDERITADVKRDAAVAERDSAKCLADVAAMMAKTAAAIARSETEKAYHAKINYRAAKQIATQISAALSTNSTANTPACMPAPITVSFPAIKPSPCGPQIARRLRHGSAAVAYGRGAPPTDPAAAKRADESARGGERLLGKGLLGPAYDAFLEALRYQPDHVGARIGIADVLAAEHIEDAAILYYTKALEASPSCRDALLGRGRLQLTRARRTLKPDDLVALQKSRNDAQAAVFDLEIAVRLDEDDDRATDDYRDAEALLEYVKLLLAPSSPAPPRARAPELLPIHVAEPGAAAAVAATAAAGTSAAAPPADDLRAQLDKAKQDSALAERQAKAASGLAKRYADAAKEAEAKLDAAKAQSAVAALVAKNAETACKNETDRKKKAAAEAALGDAKANEKAKADALAEATKKEQRAKAASVAAETNRKATAKAAKDAKDNVSIKQAAYDKSETIKREDAKAKR